jgi:hypothetical protein
LQSQRENSLAFVEAHQFSLFLRNPGNVAGNVIQKGGGFEIVKNKKQAFLPWTDDGRPAEAWRALLCTKKVYLIIKS